MIEIKIFLVIKLRAIKRIKMRKHYYWQLRTNKGKLISQIRWKYKDKEKLFLLAKQNGSFYEDEENKMLSPNGKVIVHMIKADQKGRSKMIPFKEGRQFRAICGIFTDGGWVYGSSQTYPLGYPKDRMIEEATDNMISNLGRVDSSGGEFYYDAELRLRRMDIIRLSDKQVSFVYYTKA